jgi:hypothetical protein
MATIATSASMVIPTPVRRPVFAVRIIRLAELHASHSTALRRPFSRADEAHRVGEELEDHALLFRVMHFSTRAGISAWSGGR